MSCLPRSKPILMFLLFITFSVLAFAQDIMVTGKVINKENGEPLEGVSVKVKNTTTGTVTAKDGSFTIKAPSLESVLSFTYVGFSVFEVKASTGPIVTIAMTRTDNNLDEVIVVGYSTQKRRNITGAVSTVKPSDLEDIAAPNIAGTLRGRVAGLDVSSASGRPGAAITLNIRDAQSSAGVGGATSEPLYVIDNMIVSKQTFDNLDPSMVEELSFLKDASAAIYGAAGAKGVVLVVTKKGKAGAPKLSYNGYVGVADATQKPEMLSAYDHAVLLNETYKINNTAITKFFSEADLENLKSINYKSWFDEIWQPALTQRHNLSLSGGSERMTFFIGGGYQNQNANYAGQKADKYTFRTGLTAKLVGGLKAELNTNIDNNVRYSKNGWSENDQAFLENLIQVPRWTPIMIGDKYVNYNGSNPLAQINSGFYQDRKTKSYGVNAALVFAPQSGVLKGLTARVQASQTANNTRSEEFRPTYYLYNFNRAGNNGLLYTDQIAATSSLVTVNGGSNSRLIQSSDEASGYRVFFTLQYARQFGLSDFSVLAGGEQSENRGTGMGYYYINQQIPDNPYYWAFDPTPTVNSPSASQSGKRSFFGNFSYSYNRKYTLDGIARLDASSRFAANNIWGFFPSIGAGWVVSDEDFFRKRVKFVDYLKFRVNYGLTGEDRVDENYWQERYRINIGSYLYGNTYVPGLRPLIIPNPDITWEKKRSFNFGVDLTLLKGKLSIGFEAFQNYSYDVFDKGNDQNFPMFAGFAAPVVNYRSRYNWGTEYSISYNTNIGKDLKFKGGMNFGFGNSVMERLFYNRFLLWETNVDEWQIDFGTNPQKYTSGNYGLKSAGMFRSQAEVDAFLAKNPNYTIYGQVPQPGWLYYEDIDRDGLISDRDKTTMFNRVSPAFSTGIQLGLNYKNWDWRVNIGANIGGKEFYDSKARRSVATDLKNVPAYWTDSWTESNPNAQFPRYDDPSIAKESDFWAVDGTMIRVNDMTISYAAPKKVINKLGLSNARLLLTGNNLWVLKNPLPYKDPYSSYIYDYPTLRTMSVGLNIGL